MPEAPKVNEKILKQFTKEETAFAASVLEQVFVKKERVFDDLSNDQAKIMARLIMAIPSKETKLFIFSQLSTQSQIKVTLLVPMSQKQIIFLNVDDNALLTSVYKHIDSNGQQKILDMLFNKRTDLYELLKKETKGAVTYHDDIPVEKAQSLAAMYQKEKNNVMNMLQDPNHSKLEAIKIAKHLFTTYPPDEVETFTFDIVSEFSELNIGMSTPAEFLTYLKFYFFIAIFLDTFPNLVNILESNIKQTIMDLHKLPSDEWIIKVLNQLPTAIITCIRDILVASSSMPDGEIRKIYTKLIHSITSQLPSDTYKQVTFIFQNG